MSVFSGRIILPYGGITETSQLNVYIRSPSRRMQFLKYPRTWGSKSIFLDLTGPNSSLLRVMASSLGMPDFSLLATSWPAPLTKCR